MDFKAHNKTALTNVVLMCRQRDGDVVALCEATRFGLEELVTQYLGEGVDPNSRTKTNLTPMMYCNYKPMGKLLVEHGADVKARDSDGNTPLIWFLRGLCRKNQARAYLKWLLSVGADPNDVASDGEPARKIALQKYGLNLDELA